MLHTQMLYLTVVDGRAVQISAPPRTTWSEIKGAYSECIIRESNAGNDEWAVDNPMQIYHVDRIALSFAGKPLQDHSTLADYGINQFTLIRAVYTYIDVEIADDEAEAKLEESRDRICVIGLNMKNRQPYSSFNCALQILSQTPLLVQFVEDRSLRTRNAEKDKHMIQRLFSSNSLPDAFGKLCDFMHHGRKDKKNRYPVFDPQPIAKAFGSDADAEVAKCLSSLLSSLNGELEKENAEIVKRLFSGTTCVYYKCLQCLQRSYQSEYFFVLDLPVVRYEVTLSDIRVIVENHGLICIPLLRVSNDCTVNMLKHAVVDNLRQSQVLESVDSAMMTVCSMRPDGAGSLQALEDDTKILHVLRKPNRALLMFTRTRPSSKRGGARMVKLWCLSADTVNEATSVTHNFVECEVSEIAQHILRQQPSIVEYNGHFIDATQAQNYDFKNMSVEGVNVLSMLTAAVSFIQALRDVDEFVVYEAQALHPNTTSPIDALQQELKKWQSKPYSGSIQLQTTLGGPAIDEIISSKRQQIDRTLSALKKLTISHQQVKGSVHQLRSTRYEPVHKPMESLGDCFEQYQRPTLVETYLNCNCRARSHATLASKQHKLKQCPKILFLHLDRNSEPVNLKQSVATSQYYPGQILCVKWPKPAGDDRWYAARIREIRRDKTIMIRYFYDGEIDYVLPGQQQQRIKGHYALTTHYDHSVQYGDTLTIDNTKYDLYAVVSCIRGSSVDMTRAATIKSLSDGQWYDVCDEHVLPNAQPLQHTSTATILAYQRCE